MSSDRERSCWRHGCYTRRHLQTNRIGFIIIQPHLSDLLGWGCFLSYIFETWSIAYNGRFTRESSLLKSVIEVLTEISGLNFS